MLLTARLPARDSGLTTISVNPESTVWAGSLCEWLGEAETPDAALQILQKSSFETIVLAIRSSFNSGGMPTIPDKIAWTMYQKVAEVKNHPEKLSDLWGHISKLLKKVPEDIMCIIMFFLTIARRLQSRGVTIEDRPPAVFLLKDFFPRYVGEDMSKLLLKNFEHIPPDLPLTLRAVNYKLGSRRCNVLALVSSQKIVPASGAREIRAPEERQPEW
ncbi:Hypothetical predicted protein [Lecanosticta acicola]|uniref:Uncharacterized protein n=1 Tax=Lecanosticta acicola TaxID=111012 RepID=A0AAI8YUR4_9PEZI|nr:Hypothetical predicted protein [Lecanosticta acicola]